MMKKLISYKKFKNLIDLRLFETKYGLLLSMITITLVFRILDIYSNINIYEQILISLLSNIIFTFIGLIGLLLSAMSITLSVVNKNIKSKINELNNEDSVESIVYDFIFITLLLAVEIFFAIICLFSLQSHLPILDKIWFFIFTFSIVYIFYYVILGCVNLLHQCYRLFNISLEYADVIKLEQILEDQANEFEQRFIELYSKDLLSIKKNYVQELIRYTQHSNLNESRKILYIEYYKEKYCK